MLEWVGAASNVMSGSRPLPTQTVEHDVVVIDSTLTRRVLRKTKYKGPVPTGVFFGHHLTFRLHFRVGHPSLPDPLQLRGRATTTNTRSGRREGRGHSGPGPRARLVGGPSKEDVQWTLSRPKKNREHVRSKRNKRG